MHSDAYSSDIELQPLNAEPDSLSAPHPVRHRGHRHGFFSRLSEPAGQKQILIFLAAAVLIGAGVSFIATSTRSSRHVSGNTVQDGTTITRGAFPAEPYLAPSARECRLDAAAALGPELQLATPLNYNVSLQLADPAFYQPGDATGRVAAGFRGAVNITFHIQQDAPCLSLHATNLSFSSISATLLGTHWQQQQGQHAVSSQVCLCGSDAACLTVECGRLFKHRPGSDAWIVSLGPYFAPAGATLVLQLTYTAHFGVRSGLWRSVPYPSSAQQQAGSAAGQQQQVVALSSEFDAITARTVLPCLDDPRYKATFVVQLEAPSHLAVLSNSPAASTHWVIGEDGASVARTTFMPTPPMSTYLLSFAVGAFKSATASTNSGQAVRVWTTPATLPAASVPLQLATAAVQHYQQFTGLQQSRGPDTKWDLLAAPGKSGAVENWALLMMDPERFLFSSGGAWDLFRGANVICHELAHQWFGNLVTAATWLDLLVNEGLASLAEYGCLAVVLRRQLGPLGAAVVMRGMHGPPAGVVAGVHEGPFEKTLTYDASPLAKPLLGSGVVEFAVPVYSKAAALMASVSQYAAAGAGTASMRPLQYGPVLDLMGSDPPNLLQAALQAHLRQHAYGSTTASELLNRLLQLTPPAMSSNPVAVLTGWQSPGSPLITLTATPQGLTLKQRRFCAWGLLQEDFLTNLLATANTSTDAAQLPTPQSASSGTGSSPGVLLCPAAFGGQDRAVPWTPVHVTLLPLSTTSSPPSSNSSSSSTDSSATGSSNTDSSSSKGSLCGQWVVVNSDEESVQYAAGCPDAETAAADHSPGYIIDGSGGWGVFRSMYSTPQRAALRTWVASAYMAEASAQDHGTAAPASSAAGADTAASNSSMGLEYVLTASKLLQDQAVLSLSAFGEVPGVELWEVLGAAVNASLAAHRAAVLPAASAGAPGAAAAGETHGVGFGVVLYSVLAPVVPPAEALVGRLLHNKACWLRQQDRMAELLTPVAAAAMSAFASGQPPTGSAYNASGSIAQHSSPDAFLGAMALNRLLTATALVDADTASKLCERFNEATAAAGDGADVAAVLSHIHPDLQHAVLDVAAAQPPGCQLDWSGDTLLSRLQQWYLDSRDPRISSMAAFAIAHFPARGFHSAVPLQGILPLLLALHGTSSSTQQGSPQHSLQEPASGVSMAKKHAVELAVLAARSVGRSSRFPQPESAPVSTPTGATGTTSSSSPVLAVLLQAWPGLVGSVGDATAWDVVREVAAVEVLTAQQWQQLATWAMQQVHAGSAPPAAGSSGVPDVPKVQQQRVQAVLGAAWSTVSWVAANSGALCV